jgi:hypothetical protein
MVYIYLYYVTIEQLQVFPPELNFENLVRENHPRWSGWSVLNAKLLDDCATAVHIQALLDLLEACLDGTLARQTPRWKEGAAVCVIAASGGYPDAYKTGKPVLPVDATASLSSSPPAMLPH